jgi:hypothetical protein
MVYADLHVHTTNSDGTLTLSEVPAAARDAELAAVAVTDHDRLHPDLDAPLTTVDGVELLHGIELRVDAGDQRVDLLGYGVTRTAALEREVTRLQADRVERGRQIAERVEDALGVDLDVTYAPGVGRPHIARAVVDHPETAYDDLATVFDDLIADDGPCYVARQVPDFDTGRTLLADACGLVGLAHPLRYADPDAALARCTDLDAVEKYYPYDRPVGRDPSDAARVDDAIERHDLLALGGSDAHDRTLGKTGVGRSTYETVRRSLPGPPG